MKFRKTKIESFTILMQFLFYALCLPLLLPLPSLYANFNNSNSVYNNPYVNEKQNNNFSINLEKITKRAKRAGTFNIVLQLNNIGINANAFAEKNFFNNYNFVYLLKNKEKEFPLKILSKKIIDNSAMALPSVANKKKLVTATNNKMRISFIVSTSTKLKVGAYNLEVYFANKNKSKTAQKTSYKNVVSVSSSAQHIAVIFLVDNSASMQRNDFENARYSKILSLLKSKQLTNGVREVGVYSFANKVQTNLALSPVNAFNISDLENSFKSSIAKTSKGTSTSFAGAFSFLQNLLTSNNNNNKLLNATKKKVRVVFITDGVPTNPYKGYHKTLDNNVAIYTVGISKNKGNGKNSKLEYDEKLLKHIASETGGNFLAGSSDTLEKVYNNLLPKKNTAVANEYVSAVKNTFSKSELVRIKVMPIKYRNYFTYKVSRKNKNVWQKPVEISEVVLNKNINEIMFLPLKPGNYKLKAFNTKTKFNATVFFKVEDTEKPFKLVSVINNAMVHSSLYFSNLQSGALQQRYVVVRSNLNNFSKNKFLANNKLSLNRQSLTNTEIDGSEIGNLLNHYFIVQKGNAAVVAKNIEIKNKANRVQFVFYEGAQSELSQLDATAMGAFNVNGRINIVKGQSVVSSNTYGQNSAAFVVSYYTANEKNTKNNYGNNNNFSNNFASPSAGSYYVTKVSYNFFQAAMQAPQLLYSKQQEIESVNFQGMNFVKPASFWKNMFKFTSYILVLSSLVFLVAIVLRTRENKKRRQPIV